MGEKLIYFSKNSYLLKNQGVRFLGVPHRYMHLLAVNGVRASMHRRKQIYKEQE